MPDVRPLSKAEERRLAKLRKCEALTGATLDEFLMLSKRQREAAASNQNLNVLKR